MIETIAIIASILSVVALLVTLYIMGRSQKNALTEMKAISQSLKLEPVVDNDTAYELAKAFFKEQELEALQAYSNLVVSDNNLPQTIEIDLEKKTRVPLILIAVLGISMFAMKDIDIFVFAGIEIPGLIFILLCGGLPLLTMAFITGQTWIYRDSKLKMNEQDMLVTVFGESFPVRYSAYQLLITPIGKEFMLQIVSDDKKTERLKSILSLFQNKEVVPILVVKAIQYGSIHSSVGIKYGW